MLKQVTIEALGQPDKPRVANLLQLYLHDMTSDLPFPVGEDGRFEYDYLDRFWQFPYLIRVDEEIAGFALVIDNCPITGTTPCFFMAEFFVLRGHRRSGVGAAALDQILRFHKGDWHIGVIERNRGAAAFWKKCLVSIATRQRVIRFDDQDWRLYEFSS